MIENWKDTAFGSDFGGDFLELIEEIAEKEITLEVIYQHTDLKKYIDKPDLLEIRNDNNVWFPNSDFEQYIHFEDAIIALSAIIVESKLNNGKVDLRKAYGNKVIVFKSTKAGTKPIHEALQNIYKYPEKFVLFEMCLAEEKEETLEDIKDILVEFGKILI